jgi:hypothetical protein
MRWIVAALAFPLLLAAQPVDGQQPGQAKKGLLKPALLSAKPLKAAPGDSELRKLRIARYNEALAEVGDDYRRVLQGQGFPSELRDAVQRVVRAGLAVHDRPVDRAAFLTQALELAKNVERMAEGFARTGQGRTADAHAARFVRLDVEIQLLKAKARADKSK